MRVHLFITCLTDTLFPGTGRAVVDVLERLGQEVNFRPEQTCCGQMHLNSGFRHEALTLARRFVQTFADAEIIVCPSASCVGTVREQYAHLAEELGDRVLAVRARALAERVFEFSELLVDHLAVTDVGAAFPRRVAYHPTCHSLRGIEVGDRPLRLLAAVDGLELVGVERSDECCGFGGTFAIKNPDVSSAILADKLTALEASRAQMCTALDNSCLMQIGGGLRRRNSQIDTTHLAEILACRA